MKRRGKLAEVKSGLRLTATMLLGGAWLGLVFAGMAIAFIPPRSPVTGWLILVIAALIMIATMDRWVKALPGILGYGTFGGLLMIVSGHLLNQPWVAITRFDATMLTLLLAASAAVSATFDRKLRIIDRIARFSFVFCFFWSVAAERLALMPPAIGFCFLLLAWAYDRIQRRRTAV